MTRRQGHTVAGRVTDPHSLQPEDPILLLGYPHGEAFASFPVPRGPDGSFITPRLGPGTYLFRLVREMGSPLTPEVTIGFEIVTVGAADVSGLEIAVRPDTALDGRFRMDTDNPRAEWPPLIVVNASLALDGMPMLHGTMAESISPATFVLRNAFGPRVLRCGYTLAPGSWWWPERVLLDGIDITNVPIDFSARDGGQLEIVFTQNPSRIDGTVTDDRGRPVSAPWILVSSADRALWQDWATTTTATQASTAGRFTIPVLPGRYLVRAVPRGLFESFAEARRSILRFAPDGVAVDVPERGVATVTLAVGGAELPAR